MRILIFILAIISIGFLSCKKPQNYSSIPEITHVSTNFSIVRDTLDNEIYRISVKFSFVDGDGDLGLNSNDTLGDFAPGKKYYYNLKFAFFEKTDGQYIENETIKPYYRFQNISKSQTTNNVLKGDMIVDIDLSTTVDYADTTKFNFYIYDRTLNKSNIESTTELYLNE